MKKILLFVFTILGTHIFASQLQAEQTHALQSTEIANEGKIKVTGGSVWYHIQNTTKNNTGQIPLLLIHGGPGGSSCSFVELAKELAKNRPVIVYDQLGSGNSDHVTAASLWEIHRFADELNSVIKSLHLQKVNLLAHSWGAAVAGQYLADKGTADISSVIFVGPLLNSNDWIQGAKELRKQLSPTTQAILLKHEIAGTTSSSEYQRASEEFYDKFLFHNPHHGPGECTDKDWSPNIYERMWGDSEFIVSGNLKNFDATTYLPQLKIPTLFLVGEFDEVPENIVRGYQKRMQNAKVVVIKNAAHMSMIDEPNAFVKAVNDFLSNQAR